MDTVRRSLAVVFATLTLAGCDDGTVGADLNMAVVAGSFRAEGTFGALLFETVDAQGQTVDWLARGASIRIDLRTDGTTAGRLFIPGGDEDGGDFDEDLTGTWTLDGSEVRLAHEADTFLRDMPLQHEDGVLTGTETFQVTIRIRLLRV